MLRKIVPALLVAAAVLGALPVTAQQPPRPEIMIAPQAATQSPPPLTLPMNKSQLFRTNQPIARIAVGNPAIADAVPLSSQSFYIYGKKSGSTNVSVYGGNSRLLAVLDIIVGADVEAIKKALYDMLPNEQIGVQAINDSISLTGTVDSPAKVNRAVEIAKQFVEKDKTLVNDMRVTGTQQVMLEVRVAEIQRNVAKNLDFKPFLRIGNPDRPSFSLTTQDPLNPQNFAIAVGRVTGHNFLFTETLELLESKGVAKILAEPNLIAMSGDTASFLAGGEFPIPVSTTPGAGGLPTVTIEYKQFGISLAFTPTVVDKDLINLAVAPEVSQLDKTNSVTLNGFVIPGIATRRARTTVELRDGQSFAIAGLLSSNFLDSMRGIPGIMDIPVLGALFRSSDYNRQETELVIIVTPRLVHPAPATTLVAPTDSFVPPSDAEFFLLGHVENSDSGIPQAAQGGGLIGKYGHIIR
jgi:pilus assembly protein CpaC